MSRKAKAERPLSPIPPVELKAVTLSGSIRLEGKKHLILELLNKQIGKPCTYCNEPLTLDNCSLDHKEPFNNGAIRYGKGTALRRWFDRIENLQIICRKCNGLKSNFNDLEFRQLLSFMEQHPALSAKLKGRFAKATLMHARHR